MGCARFSSVAALVVVGLIGTAAAKFASAEENNPTEKNSAPANSPATGRTAIVAALKQPVKFDFEDLPLEEAIRSIREQQKVEILFDMKALSEIGTDPAESTITCRLDGVSLKSALATMLEAIGLTAVIRDEVLLVTTLEQAEVLLDARVYGVLDLVANNDNELDFDPLIDLVTSCIGSPSWSELGGPGTIEGVHTGLVISQTDQYQTDIAELLETLRTVRKEQAAGKFSGPRIIRDSYQVPPKFDKLLQSNITLKYRETPLTEVLADLRERTGLPFQFDRSTMTDSGLDPTMQTVTIDLGEMPVRAAVKNLLRPLNLALIWKHEVPLVTTKKQAEEERVVAVYPVADLIGPHSRTVAEQKLNHEAADFDVLIDMLTGTIATSTWNELGGPGTIDGFDENYPSLVISQSAEVHELITALLAELRRCRKAEAGAVEKLALTPAKPAAPVLRVYTLGASDPKTPMMTPKEVAELVKALVDPKGWGKEDVFVQGVTGRLVVKQTPAVQREVSELLSKLGMNATYGYGSSGPAPTGGGGGF
jgi:hypothetical protein